MKAILIAFLFLSGAFAQAEATLKIPVYVDKGGDRMIPMKRVNEELASQGKRPLPESFTLKLGRDFDYFKFNHAVDEKLKAAGYDGEMAYESVPGEFNQGGFKTCFTGNGKDVAKLVEENAGGAFSEQMNIHGWKYRGLKYVNDENDDEEGATDKWLGEESRKWRAYHRNSDHVLILMAVGDDGTDVNTSEIHRCPGITR